MTDVNMSSNILMTINDDGIEKQENELIDIQIYGDR